MRLDIEQTTGALAHACNLGALITEGIQDFQYGVLTHNGLFAARLGEARAPFPSDALEAPYGLYAVQLHGTRPTTEEILGSLGVRFEIMSAVLKPYPCTGSNLVPIELLRRAMREHSLTADHIERVTVTRASNHERVGSHHTYGPFEGYLGGMYEATSSLPFALATVMVDGEITQAHFSNANDPRITAVIRRFDFEFSNDMGLLDHRLTIRTRDGRTIEARGGREFLPKPNDVAILERYALPIVGAGKIDDLQRQVAKLDTAPDVHALARCLA
jgi:2-methylcitrate dehydratase PrpD